MSGLVDYPTDGETGEAEMSMTKSEFLRRYQVLRWNYPSEAPLGGKIIALAEEAGVEWDPEPTPEPTGDLSMVRVIDADGVTWKAKEIGGEWIPLGHGSVRLWSKIPQPVTVLRPEGDDRA